MAVKGPVVLLMLIAVGVAGCAGNGGGADDGAVEGTVSEDDFILEVGKGAIEGLLVDDRFRPIDLEDDPETEFQAQGFVLLQETGQQVKTDENGQFAFVDLEPGTYTLRVTATGHEVTPARVTVEEGLFAEAQLIARRVSSESNAIITEEFSAFAPCFVNWVAYSYTADCTGDRSGETFRSSYTRNWSNYPEITAAVIEVEFNQDPPEGGGLDATARREIYHDFSAFVLFEGRYGKMHLFPGEVTDDPVPIGTEFYPWYQNETTNIIIFGRGYFSETMREAYAPVYEGAGEDAPCVQEVVTDLCVQNNSMRRGVGGSLGAQAKFLVSLFVGEPEVDPHDYCALC